MQIILVDKEQTNITYRPACMTMGLKIS